MSTLKILAADEESIQVRQELFPANSNEIVAFYIARNGNKNTYKWCDVTGKEPRLIMELEETKKVRTMLFNEDFAIIDQQKVQGLPKLDCYRLVIRNEKGEYNDVTKQLCEDYAKICKGNRCVITAATRMGDVYELHFRAKGFDRSQCFQKVGGKLVKITDLRAREIKRDFHLGERLEKLCKSAGKPLLL